MSFKTADLYDAHAADVQVMEPGFRSFGRKRTFSGPAQTVVALEDNSMVREQLEGPGGGRVLVVDGGGSLRCALVGDRLAQLAIDNDWAGLVVFGAIRDSADIDGMQIGVRALGTNPKKSVKRGAGAAEQAVTVAGVRVRPGDWVYADEDGVLVAPTQLGVV